MNIHQTKKSTWRLIHNFQWNLLQIIDLQKCKQMAEFDDFNFDTSSDMGEFEGFTPDDVIKAIEKGAQLRQINDGELSDISFDEDDDDDEQIKKKWIK
jgi:hypothetical protein